MQLSPEQKKEIEAQKEQCIFCHIVSGKIPSKKVYEDKTIIAILDINPSTKGHTLIVPKDHYPILPLIPPETLKEIFTKTKQVAHSIKEALLVKDAIVFAANGGIAGQQSPHFLLHIIPKDSGSDASGVSLSNKKKGSDYSAEIKEKSAPMIAALCEKSSVEGGHKKSGEQENKQAKQDGKFTKEKIISILKSTPGFPDVIKNDPQGLKRAIPSNPQLKNLFEGHDIDEIIDEIKQELKTETKTTQKQQEKKTDLDKISSLFK